MKKLFVFILALLLMPITVFAAEAYENFDFKVEKVDGANIKNTEIKVFASLESDPDNLIDRTSEFEFREVMWSVCVEVDCATSEEVADDAIFEADKDYVLMVRIAAKNEADINVWGTDKAKYNGTPIEELAGEYGNTGTELMIKTRTAVHEGEPVEEKPDLPVEEEPQEEIMTIGAEEACLLGLPLCCTTFLGLSLCIWILILILLILLIVIICVTKGKKKKEHPVQE